MSDDVLTRYLSDLRSRNDDVRNAAAADLRAHLTRLSSSLQPLTDSHPVSRTIADLNRRIFDLVNSADSTDKLAGILLIGQLLDVPYEENETKMTRFANYLRMIFQHGGVGDESEQRLLKEASAGLGRLARAGGALAADMVEFEVKRSLEWLEGDRSEQRRYCAVLVLNELAKQTPTLFNIHIQPFLDHIWVCIRDPKPLIREAAIDALHSCLLLISKRPSKMRTTRYLTIWNEVKLSLLTNNNTPNNNNNNMSINTNISANISITTINTNIDTLHGALLCIRELLTCCGDFMHSRYKEVGDVIRILLRDSSSKLIRETVYNILPHLAAYEPEQFIRWYLRDALSTLISTLRLGQSREVAFLSLGGLCVSIRDPNVLAADLDSIVSLVREGMTARTKKAFCAEALTCVGMLATAVGSQLTPYMHDLIEQMFSAGLSTTLVQTLTIVCNAIPTFLPTVQDRLVTGLSVILAASGNVHTSNKDKTERRTFTSPFNFTFPLSLTSSSTPVETHKDEPQSLDLIYLALQTLGTFDFRHRNLLQFVRECVVVYLEHESVRIRRRAAITCAHVLLSGINENGIQQHDDAWDDMMDNEPLLIIDPNQHRLNAINTRSTNVKSSLMGSNASPLSSNNRQTLQALQHMPRVSSHPALSSPLHRVKSTSGLATPKLNVPTPNTPPTPSALTASNTPPLPTSTSVLSASTIMPLRQQHAIILDVLQRLLTVGIADSEPSIRLCVLESLNIQFDASLCTPNTSFIPTLFVALNDETFVIREAAITIIGRLSLRAPHIVLPLLRQTLIHLLTQLQYANDTRDREESAVLLGHLIQNSHLLIKPYTTAILRTLIPRLKDPDSSVITCVLGTLARLAVIGGAELTPSLPALLPLIIGMIADKTSTVKREVALHTLSQLITATGDVVDPYITYPQLLPTLLHALRTINTWSVRREVIKLIGILGALDPAQHKLIMANAPLSHHHYNVTNSAAINAASNDRLGAATSADVSIAHQAVIKDPIYMTPSAPSIHLTHHTSADYYSTVTLTALIRLLRDPTLSVHHVKAVQAMMYIIKHLGGHKSIPFLSLIIPAILHSLRIYSEESLRDSLFTALCTIVILVKSHIRYHMDGIIDLCIYYWHDHTILYEHLLILLERINYSLKDEIKYYLLPQILPYLLSILYHYEKQQLQQSKNNATTILLNSSNNNINNKDNININNTNNLTNNNINVVSNNSGNNNNLSNNLNNSNNINNTNNNLNNSNNTNNNILENTSLIPMTIIKDILIIKVLHVLESMAPYLNEEIHLIIPALLRLCESTDVTITLVIRTHSIHCLGIICRYTNITAYASRIIHPIARMLEISNDYNKNINISTPRITVTTPANNNNNNNNSSNSNSSNNNNNLNLNTTSPNSIRDELLQTLCILIIQLKFNYLVYISVINKSLLKANIHYERYDYCINKLLNGQIVTWNDIIITRPLVRSHTNEFTFSFKEEIISNNNNTNNNSNILTNSGSSNANTMSNGTHTDDDGDVNGNDSLKKLSVNASSLKKAWEVSQRSTRDDWEEWMRSFSIELLKESSSPSLRATAIIAQKYHPLARELFNAAFINVWNELSDVYQDDLVRCLEVAFNSTTIPSETIQLLLAMAEYMEREGAQLPIDVVKLGTLAEHTHAYAKALHYKEKEFIVSPSTCVEPLISILNQLAAPDAAVGMLVYARDQAFGIEVQTSWYEKLQRWSEALEQYDTRQLEEPNATEYTIGRMRCMRALGEWSRLASLAQRTFEANADDEMIKREVAPLAAFAYWNLAEYDKMIPHVNAIDDSRIESEFMRAVVLVHRNVFDEARMCIDRTRELLDAELSALVGESYHRAYRVIVQVQQMAELEEVITYKQSSRDGNRRALIRSMWSKRLRGCQANADVWSSILAVRAMVISPADDINTWLTYSALCRKSGYQSQSLQVLSTLLGNTSISPTLPMDHPAVTFAYLKHIWSADSVDKAEILEKMKQFTVALTNKVHAQSVAVTVDGSVHADTSDMQLLRANAYIKLGSWILSLQPTLTSPAIADVLGAYQAATQCVNTYKVWHHWAVMNFRVIAHYKQLKQTLADNQKARLTSGTTHSNQLQTHQNNHHAPSLDALNKPSVPSSVRIGDVIDEAEAYGSAAELDRLLMAHVIPAIKGFFRSIALAGDASLQDILRLLTLWFAHGTHPDVELALSEGFNQTPLDTWLPVIPQIIARIDTSHAVTRRMIQSLLCSVGASHPQSLVYPLAVVMKSQSVSRETSALVVMNSMRSHSAVLVEQALTVSKELIRVAILWHEMWHEALEEASRQWFGSKNVEGMMSTLIPLHEILAKGPSTLREIGFVQSYGRDLSEAYEWCQKYARDGYESDLNQAWDLYCTVFRKVHKQLSSMSDLELQYISPVLMNARALELAVPGTYLADRDSTDKRAVCINHFTRNLKVIESKQRPRKLSIIGDDGHEYVYLLKGHEDLRQDKRVMQLFGLVNTLLSLDTETNKKELNIKGYAVIPLSPNSGLIQWLHHCDTMHALIKDYRDRRKVLLNIEHRLMLHMAPDLPLLSLIQRVEVFEYCLSKTSGMDLAKVLWLNSISSEAWFDRRTNYTRTLAVMSMVGYILGLGDRHPCNLMIHQHSGAVIHVDFGDCFEVAMTREKYPERIPFRLTRMLVAAMELSGIEGSFRSTCENVMRVLRMNAESVMAVLEAFVYDPLLGWRLLKPAKLNTHQRVDDPAVVVEAPIVGMAVAGGAGVGDMDGVDTDVLGMQQTTSNGDLSNDSPSMIRSTTAAAATSNNASAISQHATSSSVHQSPEHLADVTDELNAKALSVIGRVEAKLGGREFDVESAPTDVSSQVDRLIKEAMSHVNLCQCYVGWCPFW